MSNSNNPLIPKPALVALALCGLFVAAVVSFAVTAPTVNATSRTSGAVIDSAGPIRRIYDAENGVACYHFGSGGSGGLSCVKVR